MCILSLDSSTLPSASMTPGKVSREADRAGALTAATLLRGGISACCRLMLPGSSLTVSGVFPLECKSSMHVCRVCDHALKFAVIPGGLLPTSYLRGSALKWAKRQLPQGQDPAHKNTRNLPREHFQLCFSHIHATGSHMTVPLKFSPHSRWSPSL